VGVIPDQRIGRSAGLQQGDQRERLGGLPGNGFEGELLWDAVVGEFEVACAQGVDDVFGGILNECWDEDQGGAGVQSRLRGGRRLSLSGADKSEQAGEESGSSDP